MLPPGANSEPRNQPTNHARPRCAEASSCRLRPSDDHSLPHSRVPTRLIHTRAGPVAIWRSTRAPGGDLRDRDAHDLSGLSVERIKTRRVCPSSVAAITTRLVSMSSQIDNAHCTRLNLELVPTRTVGVCCVSHCHADGCCFLFNEHTDGWCCVCHLP
jgi:hypothetical protein